MSTSVLIEPVDDTALLELVEVVATDALGFEAIERVPNDGLMARLVLKRAGEVSPAAIERTPAMTVIVGDRKRVIIDELEQRGVFFQELAREVGRDFSAFDLVCHVAFDRPPLTRKERAKRVRDDKT
jgi:hypothetical protein